MGKVNIIFLHGILFKVFTNILWQHTFWYIFNTPVLNIKGRQKYCLFCQFQVVKSHYCWLKSYKRLHLGRPNPCLQYSCRYCSNDSCKTIIKKVLIWFIIIILVLITLLNKEINAFNIFIIQLACSTIIFSKNDITCTKIN